MSDKPEIVFTMPPPLRRLEDYEIDEPSEVPEEIDPEVDPVAALRQRLDIPDEIPDVTIAASLAAISAKGDARARWLAAFSSPLGRWLASRGTDLNTALNVVLGVAPKATS